MTASINAPRGRKPPVKKGMFLRTPKSVPSGQDDKVFLHAIDLLMFQSDIPVYQMGENPDAPVSFPEATQVLLYPRDGAGLRRHRMVGDSRQLSFLSDNGTVIDQLIFNPLCSVRRTWFGERYDKFSSTFFIVQQDGKEYLPTVRHEFGIYMFDPSITRSWYLFFNNEALWKLWMAAISKRLDQILRGGPDSGTLREIVGRVSDLAKRDVIASRMLANVKFRLRSRYLPRVDDSSRDFFIIPHFITPLPVYEGEPSFDDAMTAAYRGNAQVVASFLTNLINVYRLPKEHALAARTSTGWTLLMNAVLGGHEKLVRWLLENGASPIQETVEKDNAFIIACRMGQRSVVETLVHSKSVLSYRNAENIWGETAFTEAENFTGVIDALNKILRAEGLKLIRKRQAEEDATATNSKKPRFSGVPVDPVLAAAALANSAVSKYNKPVVMEGGDAAAQGISAGHFKNAMVQHSQKQKHDTLSSSSALGDSSSFGNRNGPFSADSNYVAGGPGDCVSVSSSAGSNGTPVSSGSALFALAKKQASANNDCSSDGASMLASRSRPSSPPLVTSSSAMSAKNPSSVAMPVHNTMHSHMHPNALTPSMHMMGSGMMMAPEASMMAMGPPLPGISGLLPGNVAQYLSTGVGAGTGAGGGPGMMGMHGGPPMHGYMWPNPHMPGPHLQSPQIQSPTQNTVAAMIHPSSPSGLPHVASVVPPQKLGGSRQSSPSLPSPQSLPANVQSHSSPVSGSSDPALRPMAAPRSSQSVVKWHLYSVGSGSSAPHLVATTSTPKHDEK
eukprot:ANDGO_08447.mRNA.1 hypothetical protein